MIENLEDPKQLLIRSGFIRKNDTATIKRLPGGVSSDIWSAKIPAGLVCIKKALPKLRVKKDWHVPISRNSNEVAWLEVVRSILPKSVPQIHYHDSEIGFFIMEYFPKISYYPWKDQLLAGKVNTKVAAEIGTQLAIIHSATYNNPKFKNKFDTDRLFFSIRLEPYFGAAAEVNPELSNVLLELSRETAKQKTTLVHGDFSPKNILIGPSGPVFLDAECAWYGDPAFDLAFCLNHILLKCLILKQKTDQLLSAFNKLKDAYLDTFDPIGIESRTANLLPALLLARVDGKSPVEYLRKSQERDFVRKNAGFLLRKLPISLNELCEFWQIELKNYFGSLKNE